MARSDRARRHRIPRRAVHAREFALGVSAEPRSSWLRRRRRRPPEGTIAEEAFSGLSRGTETISPAGGEGGCRLVIVKVSNIPYLIDRGLDCVGDRAERVLADRILKGAEMTSLQPAPATDPKRRPRSQK